CTRSWSSSSITCGFTVLTAVTSYAWADGRTAGCPGVRSAGAWPGILTGVLEATRRDSQGKTPTSGVETGSHPRLGRRHRRPAAPLARHARGETQTHATARQQPRPATARSSPGFSRRGDHPSGGVMAWKTGHGRGKGHAAVTDRSAPPRVACMWHG